MAGLNLGGITINQEEVQSYSEVIRKSVMDSLALRSLHNVQSGVKSKKQILFASKLGRIGQTSAGDCTMPDSNATIDFSDKTWDLATVEERLGICVKAVEAGFKPNNADVKSWIDRYDFSGSQQEAFIVMLLSDSITEMIWRAVWFADKNVAVSTATTATVTGTTNSALTINAVIDGPTGNGISFEIDSITATPEAITVNDKVIVASLATGTKTIADLQALIATSAEAAALITAAGTGATELAVEGAIITAGATGSSGLVSSANVKFYDYFDGIWEQIFDGVTATDITRVTISENAVVTSKDAQLTLADGASVGYLKAVRSKASVGLKANKAAIYYISGELFDNYEDYLIDAGINYNIDFEQNGLPSLKYRGNTLVNMETIWNSDEKDSGTRIDFENNAGDQVYDKPHRIVFTTPDNMPVGTLNESDFDTWRVFFDQKDMKMYIDFGAEFESKLLKEEDIVVAY